METNHLFIILAKGHDLCLFPLLRYFNLPERASCKAFHFEGVVEVEDDTAPLAFQPHALVIPEKTKIPLQLKKCIAQAKDSYQMAAKQYAELKGRENELSLLAGQKLHALRLTYDKGRSNLMRHLKAMAEAYQTRNESAYYAAYSGLVAFYKTDCINEAKLTLLYALNQKDELKSLLNGEIGNNFCEIAPALQQILQQEALGELLNRYCAVEDGPEDITLRKKIYELLICQPASNGFNTYLN